MCDPWQDTLRMKSLFRRMVKCFVREGQENAIAELETLAVALAVYIWGEPFSQHVMFCLGCKVWVDSRTFQRARRDGFDKSGSVGV